MPSSGNNAVYLSIVSMVNVAPVCYAIVLQVFPESGHSMRVPFTGVDQRCPGMN